MESISPEAEGQVITGDVQNFIEQLQYDDDEDFFRQYLQLPNDGPRAYAQPSADVGDDTSTYPGSDDRVPPLSDGKTVSTSSLRSVSPSLPDLGGRVQNLWKASLPISQRASSASKFSEHSGRRGPRMFHQAPQQTQGSQLPHATVACSKRFSEGEKQKLEKVFTDEAQKPSNSRKRQLAEELGSAVPRVNNWFQNRRAREKQLHRVQAFEASQAAHSTMSETRVQEGPTFFSEAKRLVSEGLVGDEDPKPEAGKIRLLCSLEEVEWSLVQAGVAPTISISTSEPSMKRSSFLNTVKLFVEASSQSEWQWWPLQPPSSRGKAKNTECRISWKCSCGMEREEIVPLAYASKLSHLASQFPLSNEIPERPPSSLSSVSSQSTTGTSGSESQSLESGSASAFGSSSPRGGIAETTPSSSVISFGTPTKAFVFLVVKASRYTLAPIDVTGKKARDFFQALVEEYNKRRGWCRRLLSINVYSHSEFVKIKRYAPHSFDPGYRFSFPPHDESPHDKEYEYYPRPMLHAPVSRHMFNHLFNACYSDQGLAHKLHHAFKTPSCIIKTIPGKLLDGIPKRDRLVDEEAEFSEDQDVEVFWGLVAREQRSAQRVVMYMLLGLGPSLWFMLQWLFGWGHDGDLQNATVPLTFSVTMLGILWAVVYSGDDVREVEQPL